MTTDYLRERLEALGAGPDTADWDDARRRAKRLRQRRRRIALATASLVGVVAIAAPAFAVAVGVISFSTSEPAPQAAKLQFAELNTGAPEGMAPGALAQDARSILSRALYNGTRTLWVAPTTQGGFCFTLSGKDGGTGAAGTCSPTSHHPPINLMITQATDKSPVIAFGAISTPDAAYVEFTHQDGTTTRTDVVWVTPPIDAAFFVAEANAGNQMTAMTVRNGAGDEVARKPIRTTSAPKVD